MSKPLPGKYTILSIFVAGLMVGGIILYVQLVVLPQYNTGQDVMAAEAREAAVIRDQVDIPADMTECVVNESCIVVDTTCSFCCKYVAINSKHEQRFNQKFDQSCATYKGGNCECFDLSTYPKCINRKCRLVEWSDNGNDLNRPIQ